MLQHVHRTHNVAVNQQYLGRVLADLFPNEKIVENSRNFILKETGHRLQYDFWLPALKLSFEFQGPHHYTNAWYSPFSREKWEGQDYAKKRVADEEGFSVVAVPYWWDGDKESLKATIKAQRKDLFPEIDINASPIPTDSSFGNYKPYVIPGVGELMHANFVPNKHFDLISWWMSEKYDGMRACWNCKEAKLYGKTGRTIALYFPLLSHFPTLLFLDAEIWFGRESFRESHALALQSDPTNAIEYFRLVAFDSPSPSPPAFPFLSPSASHSYAPSSSSPSPPSSTKISPFISNTHGTIEDSTPFELRYELIIQTVLCSHPFIILSANSQCKSKLHVRKILDDIWKTQGEGLVLIKPKSNYTKGNSDDVVKIKAYRDDEGLVSEVGEYTVTLTLANGATISANKQPDTPEVEVGDVVTYTYALSTKGNLRNPRILRSRPDLRWNDILYRENHNEEQKKKVLPPTTHAVAGHYTSDEGRNVIRFFENFAVSRNFDPLVASNWYSITFYDILREKGGAAVLSIYNNSLARALVGTFPNIGLDISKFKKVPQRYWKNIENQRIFLVEFAKERGFDPLVPDNWYNLSHKDLRKFEKVSSLLDQGLYRVLQTVFSGVDFDPSKFVGMVYWRSWQNRRTFFDDFASQNGFDPLVIENWYQRERLLMYKFKTIGRGRGMFKRYYGSLFKKALLDLYICTIK